MAQVLKAHKIGSGRAKLFLLVIAERVKLPASTGWQIRPSNRQANSQTAVTWLIPTMK